MIGAQLRGRRILLTGVTGFLGKVWLAHVLWQVPDVGRVHVLVRPRGRKESARARFERIVDTSPVFRPLREAHGAELGAWLGARLEVLSGDVELPLLGLGSDTVARLRGELDAVVHCAGLTDFQPDPLRAIAVNVAGTHHAADLAGRVGASLLHVSTCFVAGFRDGEVPEELPSLAPSGAPLDVGAAVRAVQDECGAASSREERVEIGLRHAREAGWPNIYTWSKALAEQLVAQRRRLRYTIVRPSIVECARTFPFPGWNEGLNTAGPLAWLISTSFRRLPARPGNVFDVIPVDDVARGTTLALAHLLRGDAPPVVQLASGDENPLTFGRTVELTGLGFRRYSRRQPAATGWDRLLPHLDPVPAPQAASGPLSVANLKRAAATVRDGLREVSVDRWIPGPLSAVFGEPASAGLRRVEAAVAQTHDGLARVEHMLELYRPFIHDHDYRFVTAHVRRMSDALDDEDREFRWAVPDIDWRHYWVDVEFPGLWTWSVPLIRGEEVPMDPASDPPFRLVEDAVRGDRQAASK